MPRINNFVIPTENGEVILHVSPGPCSHQEHWIDALRFGFRDSIRSHTGIHALIGLFWEVLESSKQEGRSLTAGGNVVHDASYCCSSAIYGIIIFLIKSVWRSGIEVTIHRLSFILIQLSSTHPEFIWYGRFGLGTWAGLLFFCTCFIGSYASSAEVSPSAMRSWLLVYSVFCFLAGLMAGTLSMINTILANYHHMSDWQHAVLSFLGSIELFFCIIQMTLVLYRLYTSSPVPQGFDLHVLVEYSADSSGLVTSIPESDPPPPSYDQLYQPGFVQANRPASSEILSTVLDSPSGGEDADVNLPQRNEFPLAVLRRGVMQTIFGWREGTAARS